MKTRAGLEARPFSFVGIWSRPMSDNHWAVGAKMAVWVALLLFVFGWIGRHI